jgi:hypothetical protein
LLRSALLNKQLYLIFWNLILFVLTLFVTKICNCRIILTILGAFIDLKAGIWGRIIEGLGALNDKFMNRLIG